ncbi:hypothetical protein GOARA_064_00200 [Gordonia araii NBRC 100433]|uniref:KTSC domain-containing protein n=1 Tax=Gordonia araii NBRC 100433 TaxID=1073574 RepID=G7H593_9ACTN|nr:KTSC domain-containing protein [Gordonia araii]NNG95733.1 KTSC domain-containing protein [Gordonia araii NBRC 100433]GAB11018.1 hypothetical protein GOARA_064_00200 [Gordonia araii NBRC 100433]
MKRRPVSSSSLASVGYDEPTSTLEIEFTSGSVYQYFDVPAEVYSDLMSASCLGRFFSRRVRGRYRYLPL